MNRDITARVRRSIDTMPPLSPVVHKVVSVANDMSASAQELTEVIQMDPVLMARILRLVNSAYFGMSHEITNLKQAVVILGINTIKNVALSSTVLENLALKKNPVLDAEEFWTHSFAVGIASKRIAGILGADEKLHEEYFAAGLMHDIGMILMNNTFAESLEQIMEQAARNEKPITRIEKDILGLTHEEIGIAIGKHWNFEKRYLYAVGRHHKPSPGGKASHYAMVVGVADYCVRQLHMGSAIEGTVASIPVEVWNALGLEEEEVMQSLTSLEEEIQKARVFLE